MALYFILLAILIGTRFTFCLCMGESDSKAYAQSKNAGFFDKWFFISMHKAVRDKYVKAEGRIVRYSASAKAYYITNMVLHIAFAIITITEIVAILWIPLKGLLFRMYTVYSCLLWFTWLEIAVITNSENRKYYRNKDKRR